MATIVAGDMYMKLDGQLHEIKRQIRQPGGYPFDPEKLSCGLQELVEGRFEKKAEINILGDTEAQLASWKAFYTKYFGVEVDTAGIKIPERVPGFDRLIVVPKGLTMNAVVKAMRKQFEVYLYTEDLDEEVSKNDRDPQNGTYAIWLRDRVEADEELKNLSANDLAEQGTKGITITLLERLLYELKYFAETETGKHLDEQNWTLCSGSRSAGGDVPGVYGGPGGRGVGVVWRRPGAWSGDLRSRAVSL